MTDKIIIKNGVDVSGCPDFDKYDETTCKIEKLKKGYPVKCTSCGYCNYKQLQREKQNSKDTYEMYQTLMESFNILQKELVEERKKKNKYKQAFKKIKDKAKENDELLQGYHLEWANNKLILEIINEVLEDE